MDLKHRSSFENDGTDALLVRIGVFDLELTSLLSKTSAPMIRSIEADPRLGYQEEEKKLFSLA